MHRFARLAAAASVAVGLTLGTAGAASARPSSNDAEAVRTANPAQACASIPDTLAQFGVTPEGFDFTSCVRTLAGRVPDLPFGSPYQQCAALEAGMESPEGFFSISYPYTFHAELGDPFPNLRAHSREQCARALWAFHTLASFLPAGPPPS